MESVEYKLLIGSSGSTNTAPDAIQPEYKKITREALEAVDGLKQCASFLLDSQRQLLKKAEIACDVEKSTLNGLAGVRARQYRKLCKDYNNKLSRDRRVHYEAEGSACTLCFTTVKADSRESFLDGLCIIQCRSCSVRLSALKRPVPLCDSSSTEMRSVTRIMLASS